jgi:hypothetical protein
VLLIVSSALLALALLGQAFTAGMAAIVNPQWWQTHVAWVHIFQWLVVIIPVSAAASSARRHIKWVSLGPLVLMGTQYVLAHRGMEGNFPIGLGLHAVGALILFGMAAYLLFEACKDLRKSYKRRLVGPAEEP